MVSWCYGWVGCVVFVSVLVSVWVGIGRFYFGILCLWEIGIFVLLLLFLIVYCVDYKIIFKIEFCKYVW